jgi:hypothetical protein
MFNHYLNLFFSGPKYHIVPSSGFFMVQVHGPEAAVYGLEDIYHSVDIQRNSIEKKPQKAGFRP